MSWYGMHHVHLICKDEKATEEFYTEIMGFDLEKVLDLPDGRRALFFSDGTYNNVYFWSLREDSDHSLVGKQQAPFGVKSQRGDAERPYEFVTGIHHLSWGVQSEDELYEIKEKLESHDVPVWGPVNRSNFAFDLYFEDPNGINLEIHTPGPDAGKQGVFETSMEAAEGGNKVTVDQTSEGTVREGAEDGISKQFRSSFWE